MCEKRRRRRGWTKEEGGRQKRTNYSAHSVAPKRPAPPVNQYIWNPPQIIARVYTRHLVVCACIYKYFARYATERIKLYCLCSTHVYRTISLLFVKWIDTQSRRGIHQNALHEGHPARNITRCSHRRGRERRRRTLFGHFLYLLIFARYSTYKTKLFNFP